MARKPMGDNITADDEPLMSVADVAKLDDVSTKTVKRRIEKKELLAFRLGGQWRVSRKDHQQFRRRRWTG